MTDLKRHRRRRQRLYYDVLLLCVWAAAASATTTSASDESSSSARRFGLPSSSPLRKLRRGYFNDEDFSEEEGSSYFIGGRGREFDLFDTREGVTTPSSSSASSPSSSDWTFPRVQTPSPSSSSSSPSNSNNNPNGRTSGYNYPSYSSSSSSSSTNRAGGRAYTHPNTYNSNYNRSRRRRDGMRSSSQQQRFFVFLEPVQDWWCTYIAPSIKSWPKLSCKVEPTTTLKIRKTFRPIGTIVKLGADFNTQLGVWQFKSSWEDAIIGGKLTLAGRELQITKSWQLSMGQGGAGSAGKASLDDLVTRLKFRAAVDLQTWKAYVRVGFRTERLSPINVLEGFTILRQVPLDGTKGHVKLEVKANLSLPEPEIEYSTETQRSLVGMGDIEISVEELNLLLDY